MKRLLTLAAILLLAACGGGTAGQSNIKKYYLARNVLFNSVPLVASANAEETVIDTETQINADQVLLDNTDTSLNATNVQDAFVETTPDLNTVIIGTWTLTKIDSTSCTELMGLDTFTCEIGRLTFHDDGTFTIDSFIYGYGVMGLIPVFGTEGETSVTKSFFQIIENSILAASISTFDEVSGNTNSDVKTYSIIRMSPSKIVTSEFTMSKIQ